MSKHITIARESDDGLTKAEWRFVYFDTHHALVLDGYVESARPTKRHKFTTARRYSRLSVGSRSDYGGALLAEADVPIDDLIATQVLNEYINGLRIAVWSTVAPHHGEVKR